MVELQFLKMLSISSISKKLKSTLVELQFLPQDAISFPPGGCSAFWRFYQSSLFCSIRCFKYLKYPIYGSNLIFQIYFWRTWKMLAQFLPCLVRSRPSYSIEHGLPGEQSMTLTLMKGQVRTWTDQYHSSQRAVKTSKKTTSPFLHTCSSHWRYSCQRRRWKDVWQKKMKIITATDILELTW